MPDIQCHPNKNCYFPEMKKRYSRKKIPMLDINESTKAQPHYYVRATYMDIHTIGCTIEPLSLGIFKKVCWYGKFVFILVLPSWSVRQKWRCAILRTTYIRKRSSRAGTISTRTILSHTPRHAQPLSAPPGRVYGERITQHTLLNIPSKGGLNCASDGV